MALNLEETPDELGFTSSDYCDMQTLKDKDGKLNDKQLSGWDVTPEQITLINNPRHPLHRVAVIAFYDVNYKRLKAMSLGFFNKANEGIKKIVSNEDLLQQLFCDLLSGCFKLPHKSEHISNGIFKCFRYAAVGGLEGVENVKTLRTA